MTLRPTLAAGLCWIALNDNAGEDTGHGENDADNIAGYISTALLADLFGVPSDVLGKVIAAMRRDGYADDPKHATFLVRSLLRAARAALAKAAPEGT